ncbi:MAG: hypothetical protein R3300_12425 [Candidatus Promineifilaceae bacterium]|nr:hypothetical protein [Candidatus Promineifilaceae bacterium]
MMTSESKANTMTAALCVRKLNSTWHQQALSVYLLVVFGHWAEHIAQAYQVFVLEWPRPEAGGVLGLWFPQLASSEILHFVYNLGLLLGLLLLRPGFRGRGRSWWTAALVIQGWHFFEHLLLQGQWLTGFHLFGASQPMSILQLWLPRVELHFIYNTVVFAPMMVGMVLEKWTHR